MPTDSFNLSVNKKTSKLNSGGHIKQQILETLKTLLDQNNDQVLDWKDALIIGYAVYKLIIQSKGGTDVQKKNE